MKKEMIDSVVTGLAQFGISCELGNATDIKIEKEFLNVKLMGGNNKIHFLALAYFCELDSTIYYYETSSETGSGISMGMDSESSFQSGTTVYRKIKNVSVGPNGENIEYELDLGSISKIFKDIANANGWKFKTVLSKKKAMFPETTTTLNSSNKKPPFILIAIITIIVLIILFILFTGGSNSSNNTNSTSSTTSNTSSTTSNTSTAVKLPNYKVYYSYIDFTSGVTSYIGLVNSDGTNLKEISLDNSYNPILSDGNLYVLKDNEIYKGKSDLSGSFSSITDVNTDYITRYYVYNSKVYYSKDNSNASDEIFAKLALVNSDGSSSTIIDENIPDQIFADKDGLFEVSMDAITHRKIIKYDLNGSNKVVFESGAAQYMAVSGDYIYYTNTDDNFNLYRIKKDGTSKTKILDNKLDYSPAIANQSNGNNFFGVIGDYIYYINKNAGNNLCKVKTDGTGDNLTVISKNISKIYIKGEYIYYTISYGTSAGLYIADKNGNELKKLVSKNIDSFIVE